MGSSFKQVSLTCALLFLAACNQQNPEPPMATSISTEQLTALAQQRVVFAHQSVGNDILDGLQQLAARHGVAITVAETTSPPPSGSGLFHFMVGSNGDPAGKLSDFATRIDAVDVPVDVAMVKLCYIDFRDGTDARALARQYIDTIEKAQRTHPNTRVVAMTVPLSTVQTGPKAWIKRVLGKPPAGYVVNTKRQTFNDELRRHFDEHQLFDIARLEASHAHGRETFEFEGQTIEALNPTLTSDGGHLNDAGKAVVASSLVHFLTSN